MSDSPKVQQIPLAKQFRIVNEQRVVVLTGRDQFALSDTVIAVPFGLLKHLAGSLVTAEGQAELQRLGMTLQDSGQAQVT